MFYTHIDQTLVNSLYRLLNCEIGGLECHGITTVIDTCFILGWVWITCPLYTCNT